ncbi:MAG: chromosome segregation protein SMC [Ruminococcaceae bacterium]|nr:chromosome segregation protein SMC [Oscillospiraceae bacterium]
MILKSLEMQGFKSFPDKTVLEFGKGITAVVGPNGSGKSNISDAVRWVLGEQSTKTLRGAKMEDVIFGGTSQRKALGYAEVTLRLDNTDRGLNSDKDDVSVTRRYYRSGDSEYKINGEVCRLRDIHELFMDTGLGRDGYSMVGQGRIADLVSARSTQRRDMLEEAAGISHFRYRRADANRRLDQAEENLVRLRDILAELESRIGPLKTQSEKAMKFLALADEKKTLEIGLWLHTIEKSKNGLREQEHKLSVAASQYEQTENALVDIIAQIEQAISEGQAITLEIERLRESISASEEEATAIDGKIAVERNTIEHNEQTVERITGDMGDSEASKAEIDAQIEQAQADITEKEKTVAEKKAALEAELKKLTELMGQNSENSEKVREINEEITALTLKLADLRVEKSTAESAKNELNERISNINGVVESRGGVITALEKEKSDAQLELDRLNAVAAEHENALDGYRMIIGTRADKVERVRKELENLNLDIYQKNARIKMLDDLEKNLDGYAGSVQKVIKEAKRGALRGIHGTLSQLISTPGEYAVAVETALGAAIQNIVTDNENTAKLAINFLKENRAGRATFLPLTSVKSRPFTENGLEKCEGFVDMADRLLEYDSKYSEIIGSLLGRTAVVDNIDNGIAMAKKYSYRFKIVTLDGQVLNAGGSMTGGSRGSGSGFLSRTTEIEALKEKVAALEKQLAQKEESHKTLSEELALIQAELDASEAELIKAQEDIIRAESALDLIKDRYNAAKGHIDELEAEKERAAARIAESEDTEKKAQSEIETVTAKIEELNSQLSGLNAEKETLDKLREDSAEVQNALNLEIVSLCKDIEADNEIIAGCLERKESFNRRADKLNEEIAEIRRENEEILSRIADFEAQAAALRENSVKTREKIEQLMEKRVQCEGQSTSLRTKEREMTTEREKLGGELARLEERRDSMQRELETAQNKLYDEYQLSLREAAEMNIVLDDIPKAQRTLQEIKNKIRALGSVNVGAVEEYKEVSERYEYMSGQIGDIEKAREELIRMIEELTGKMAERFREQFRRINNHFGETFKDLFDGGKAELVLEDPQDVLECAINIRVQPPGKNVQNIDLLSGGEKGLAAIALLFAILKVTPAPFCIFDEVEAALDDVNVSRYASYVREMTGSTQFILITHRRGTMDEADMLYGVTMQEKGVSKLLELKTAEMAKKLGLE